MENRTFLGMPIEGDIYNHYSRDVTQLSKEEVGALIHGVLELPNVRGLAWTQCTPYFNDGDTCVFRVHTPYISLVGLEQNGYLDESWMEEDSDFIWIEPYNDQFDIVVGDDEKTYSGTWPDRTWEYKVAIDDQPNPTLFRVYMTLYNAMNGGGCDHVMLELFGDHAQVIVDNEASKVRVESYEHD